jgi:hypothetical protein
VSPSQNTDIIYIERQREGGRGRERGREGEREREEAIRY